MYDSAKRWWHMYVRGRPTGSPPLTWAQFSQLFLEKFIPLTQIKEFCSQFECFQQGSMVVTRYETIFVDLSYHTTIMIPAKRERVQRFIDGLTYGIRLQMARETEDDISFTQVVEIARRIECLMGQARETTSDKRPRYVRGFNGASSRGRGSFGRGYHIRQVQSALQVTHGASGSCGAYESLPEQLAFSTPPALISAPPIQCYHGGYSGCWG
ncbi:uncharacterized protein [Nicotiana tomentosiformis]|uniref:uncharacterized protein n=1 Tax=Nicotiana tomentosiformis TaxID=4098 RepID=UPI00388CE6C0